MTALRDLDRRELRALVELLTLRLTEGVCELPAESRSACSEAVTYALDAAVVAGVIDRHESIVRRLNLSLALLRQVPPDAGVDILDPDRMVGLLLRALPMSAREAHALSTSWRMLDVDRIRALRAAKDLLSPGLPLARMASSGDARRILRDWEQVFPALP